jgi:hypothetical protein
MKLVALLQQVLLLANTWPQVALAGLLQLRPILPASGLLADSIHPGLLLVLTFVLALSVLLVSLSFIMARLLRLAPIATWLAIVAMTLYRSWI